MLPGQVRGEDVVFAFRSGGDECHLVRGLDVLAVIGGSAGHSGQHVFCLHLGAVVDLHRDRRVGLAVIDLGDRGVGELKIVRGQFLLGDGQLVRAVDGDLVIPVVRRAGDIVASDVGGRGRGAAQGEIQRFDGVVADQRAGQSGGGERRVRFAVGAACLVHCDGDGFRGDGQRVLALDRDGIIAVARRAGDVVAADGGRCGRGAAQAQAERGDGLTVHKAHTAGLLRGERRVGVAVNAARRVHRDGDGSR